MNSLRLSRYLAFSIAINWRQQTPNHNVLTQARPSEMNSNDKAAALQHVRKSFTSILKESNGVVSSGNFDKLLQMFNRVSSRYSKRSDNSITFSWCIYSHLTTYVHNSTKSPNLRPCLRNPLSMKLDVELIMNRPRSQLPVCMSSCDPIPQTLAAGFCWSHWILLLAGLCSLDSTLGMF